MAFNKDASQIARIPSFRQQGEIVQSARPPRGGGKGAPYFVNQFKPNDMAGADPDKVHLIRGNYDVSVGHADGSVSQHVLWYFPVVEHFYATAKKGFICSAGPLHNFKGKGDPCYGCERYYADKMAGIKNGPMGKRELYVLSTLHLGNYVKTPQIDRHTGQARTNDKGEPYWQWEHVQPHEARSPKYQGCEKRDWNLMHWAMGHSHWDVLQTHDKQIGKSCANCYGRDTVETVVWLCPSCGIDLIDPNTSNYSPAEIEKLTKNTVRCSNCNTDGYLQEVISCNGCQQPRRADVFDVDLLVSRIADGKGGKGTTLAIMGYSNPGPLQQRFLDVSEEFKTPIAHPIDLPKIYTPASIEEQAEMLGTSTPTRTPVTPDQMSRGWSGTQGVPVLGLDKV